MNVQCVLMEQYSTEERSLIGSERCVYIFGDRPLPLGTGPCNHAERNALAGDAAKVRDSVKRCVDTGGEQRVALLNCVERVAPLLDGCVAGDLGRKCTVSGKGLVEEAEELFKSAERTEKISGLECERPKFKGGRRHEAFLSRFKARDAASSLHGEVCTDEACLAWSYAPTVSGTHSSMKLSSSALTSWLANSSASCSARSR
jgi:hypothetical protein